MLLGTARNINKLGSLLAIRIDSHLIRRVYKSRYLGLIVDDKLSWTEHIAYISAKIRQNICVMKRTKRYIPNDTLIMLYRTLVEPYLRYCNTTWGNCGATLLNRLQTLQNRAARVITGISYEDADHNRILKDLNILNVRQLIELDTASLMYRVENDLVPAHVKSMFTECSEIHAFKTSGADAGNYFTTKIRTKKGKQAF